MKLTKGKYLLLQARKNAELNKELIEISDEEYEELISYNKEDIIDTNNIKGLYLDEYNSGDININATDNSNIYDICPITPGEDKQYYSFILEYNDGTFICLPISVIKFKLKNNIGELIYRSKDQHNYKYHKYLSYKSPEFIEEECEEEIIAEYKGKECIVKKINIKFNNYKYLDESYVPTTIYVPVNHRQNQQLLNNNLTLFKVDRHMSGYNIGDNIIIIPSVGDASFNVLGLKLPEFIYEHYHNDTYSKKIFNLNNYILYLTISWEDQYALISFEDLQNVLYYDEHYDTYFLYDIYSFDLISKLNNPDLSRSSNSCYKANTPVSIHRILICDKYNNNGEPLIEFRHREECGACVFNKSQLVNDTYTNILYIKNFLNTNILCDNYFRTERIYYLGKVNNLCISYIWIDYEISLEYFYRFDENENKYKYKFDYEISLLPDASISEEEFIDTYNSNWDNVPKLQYEIYIFKDKNKQWNLSNININDQILIFPEHTHIIEYDPETFELTELNIE